MTLSINHSSLNHSHSSLNHSITRALALARHQVIAGGQPATIRARPEVLMLRSRRPSYSLTKFYERVRIRVSFPPGSPTALVKPGLFRICMLVDGRTPIFGWTVGWTSLERRRNYEVVEDPPGNLSLSRRGSHAIAGGRRPAPEWTPARNDLTSSAPASTTNHLGTDARPEGLVAGPACKIEFAGRKP